MSKKLDNNAAPLIISALRQASLKMPSRAMCLKKARKRVLVGTHLNGTPKYKYHWQCAKCLNWFSNIKEIEVDHIVEIGPFTGDLNEWASRLFCGPENLQALCLLCHAKKTSNYNASLRYQRREK